MKHRSKVLICLLMFGGAVSCVDTSAPPVPKLPLSEVLKSISVDPEAVIMALDDSLQLNISALNMLGEPLSIPNGAPVEWTSNDGEMVSVDSTGKIKALGTTGAAFINITAKWTHNGYTGSQTVIVNVTPTRQSIAGLRITPKDTTRTSDNDEFGGSPTTSLSVMAMDANGNPIGKIRVPLTPRADAGYSYKDLQLVYLGPIGALLGLDDYLVSSNIIGDYMLYARANVYGTSMVDSLKFTGLYPSGVTVPIQKDSLSNSLVSTYTGQEFFMQPCGNVKFENKTQSPIGIVFSDSTKADGCVPGDPSGNIASIPPGQKVTRKFSSTGTIQWTLRDPATGNVVPAVSGRVTMRTED